MTRAEWWEKEGGAMPQRLSALVVCYGRSGPSKAPPSLPPPTEAWLPNGKLPEGAVAAGRGPGRVGVELSEGEGEWVLFAWAYPPRRAAQTTSTTASSAPSRSPQGELTPGALGD